MNGYTIIARDGSGRGRLVTARVLSEAEDTAAKIRGEMDGRDVASTVRIMWARTALRSWRGSAAKGWQEEAP